jgi:hypothetical protein
MGRSSSPCAGKIFSLSPSIPVLEPTHPPMKWVPDALSLGVNRAGRESGHSPPSNADVKNGGALPPLPHTPSWCSAYEINHRGNSCFTVILYARHVTVYYEI